MSNVEEALSKLRTEPGGDVVMQQAEYALRTRMGVQGGVLADALVADFNAPPEPEEPPPPPETQTEILAAAGALIGRLTPTGLRLLEETLLDALQSSACTGPGEVLAPAH
jgi:hypothetical protein